MNFKLLKATTVLPLPLIYLYYQAKGHKINAESPAKEPELVKNVSMNQYESSNKRSSWHVPLKHSKNSSKILVERFRTINNAPGVVCAVSYRGKEMWSFGQGLADIETGSFCSDETVMRIASISKSMTMVLLGKLLEQGKLDLDKPIRDYLDKDKWPDKYFDKEKVDITLRQLVSHLGGIRHYIHDENMYPKEFYLNKFFESVYESLGLFKDDDLINKPGTKFSYTTHGFTLISAVIQSVLDKDDKKFETELVKFIRNELRMHLTYLDTNELIIPKRAKYYMKKKVKNENGKMVDTCLINVPEVDNSYKVAGGGLLSNVHDMLKFGNAMLYSYKTDGGILKKDTMKLFWTQNKICESSLLADIPFRYAMGFNVSDDDDRNKYSGLMRRGYLEKIVFHGGCAVGVSSLLLIYPEEEIVIALMTNLQECQGLGQLGTDIAKRVYKNLVHNRCS